MDAATARHRPSPYLLPVTTLVIRISTCRRTASPVKQKPKTMSRRATTMGVTWTGTTPPWRRRTMMTTTVRLHRKVHSPAKSTVLWQIYGPEWRRRLPVRLDAIEFLPWWARPVTYPICATLKIQNMKPTMLAECRRPSINRASLFRRTFKTDVFIWSCPGMPLIQIKRGKWLSVRRRPCRRGHQMLSTTVRSWSASFPSANPCFVFFKPNVQYCSFLGLLWFYCFSSYLVVFVMEEVECLGRTSCFTPHSPCPSAHQKKCRNWLTAPFNILFL